MEILALKTSLALDSQKIFENKELEALLEEDQSQTQACRIIEGNSTSRFCTIESHEKQENWVPYELKPKDIERFFTCE